MPVAAGQIWADTAWQQKGRTIVIEAVVGGEEDGTCDACTRVLTDADTPHTFRSTVGRRSRVRISSNGGIRGYRLISTSEGETQ
jgi:hypothetical protein